MNMMDAIREGRFRKTFNYRLNAVPINIPPLRERKEDIPLLFRKFASDFAEKYTMPPIKLNEEAGNTTQKSLLERQCPSIEKLNGTDFGY